ncbi:MAG: D-tyrosyl-tRNA(Tyr) deacylase [Acidobacteria bacterium]|jgi:D-aminoacyl-tRNA deacylase|nr:D-tyrosyl-tRNA(Tyr) deacylase [Acidobacteriota bacterium]
MRAVITRVTFASVSIEGRVVSEIEHGLLVLIGVAGEDGSADSDYVAAKIRDLRIFGDTAGKMNLSVVDVGGSVLAVSQFTLLADVRRGRRPSFIRAAPPEAANEAYEGVVDRLRASGLDVKTGVFQADMQVASVNDGPVTIWIDSRG